MSEINPSPMDQALPRRRAEAERPDPQAGFTDRGPVLTIGIPTYCRNESLAVSLRCLAPQMTEECCLLIIDNASITSVEDAVDSIFESLPDLRVRVERNRANIGGNANVLRCFEQCDTDWLWVLGDDDVPAPGALDSILRAIHADPDALLVNFSTAFARHRIPVSTLGLTDLLVHTEALGDLLFISGSVFNCRRLLPFLEVGYQYCSSSAPHLALLFVGLEVCEGRALLSPDIIITGRVPGTVHRYSIVKVAMRLGMLADLDVSLAAKQRLRILLRASWPSFEIVTCYLLAYVRKGGSKSEALRMLDAVRFMKNLQRAPRAVLCRALLRSGVIGWFVVNAFVKLRYGCPLELKLTDPVSVSDSV